MTEPPVGPPVDDETHRQIREQLGAYALDQLRPDERESLDQHLESCAACRAELAAIAPLAAPLARVDPDELVERRAEPVPAPDGFAAILTRIRAEQAQEDTASSPEERPDRAVAAAQPDTAQPDTAQPDAAQPDAAQPDIAQPDTAQPDTAAHRARTRWFRRPQLIAAAAALVVGLSAGIAIGYAATVSRVPIEPVAVQVLDPGVTADAGLVAHTWGVEVKLTATGFEAGRAYQVSILDRDGRPVSAGTFVGIGAGEMRCNLNSSLPRDQATGFVVTEADGRSVLVSQFS